MVKIEAIIQPFKLADVQEALRDLDVARLSISQVLSQGGPSPDKLVYRGAEYCADRPMIKLEILISSLRIEEVVEAMARAARTGFSRDDGTILIYEVADAISIRSGERIELALS